ncbi:AAA family ATPase [Loigolactobacillus binensis]|uniref:Nuclease SbcCD subunit C n=1 Tax=Loigolactobacillus binensis TaxID=2559922 RepID=A0ABW3EC32_9LACO|nr:SMC family ATPase [Loigolactobacillus binensis]
MRPLNLTMINFGPYANETIDFTKFQELPLFLISGKTGSGKTTIFDGLCYALFGVTSGQERDGKMLRSDFATAADLTQVSFRFSHRNREYLIVRQPDQLVAKKRGTGYRDQPAKVTLTVYQQGKEIQELTKKGQVATYIQDLLHLDANQFAQIVLLPQGEFRKFLMSDSNDKEKVLRNLFGTQIYERWAQVLKDQRRTADKAFADANQQVNVILQQAFWLPEFQAAADSSNPDDVLAALQQQLPELTQRATVAEQQMQAARQSEQQHQAALTTAQQQAKWLQEQQANQAALAALTEQEPAMAALQQQIKALEWARGVQPVAQQCQQLTAQQHELGQNLTTLRQQQPQLKAELSAANTQLNTLQAMSEQQTSRQEQLHQGQALLPLYQEVTELTQTIKKTTTAAKQAQQAEQHSNTKQQQLIGEQTRLNDLLATGGKLAQDIAELTSQQQAQQQIHQQITALQQQATQIKTAETDLAQQQTKLTDLQTASVQAETNFLQIKSDWAATQIARLQQELLPGQPCPVCGSLEHQIVAPTQTKVVSEQDYQTAETTWQHAQAAAARLAGQVTTTAENVKQQRTTWQTAVAALLKTTATTATDLTELMAIGAQTQQNLAQQLAAKQQQQSQLDQATLQLTKLKAALLTNQTVLQQQQQQSQALTQQLIGLQTQQQNKQQQLPAAFADQAALQQQLEQLQQKITLFEHELAAATKQQQAASEASLVNQTQIAEQDKQLTAVTQQLTQQQAVLAQTLATAGQTRAQLQQLLALLPQLDEQRHQLQAFNDQRLQLETRQQSLTTQLTITAPPDLTALKQQLAQATAKLRQNEQSYYQLKEYCERDQQVLTQVTQKLAGIKQQMAALAELTQLAEVANGDGPQKLSLERYVLQTYLREVLRVANQRLSQLTQGRYQFQLRTVNGSFRTNTGLEIDVYDDNCGAIRSVHTLSGGESFIAALTLALALGEVIQQEAGGIEIEALFIDEGFGSLDEDALATALDALETVEGKHRMIGIISHVKELQEQVPDQLQVRTNGNGQSHVRYQLGFEV